MPIHRTKFLGNRQIQCEICGVVEVARGQKPRQRFNSAITTWDCPVVWKRRREAVLAKRRRAVKRERKAAFLSVKKLDTLWARLIKRRDEGTCLVCGTKPEFPQAMHGISRGEYCVRWNLANGFTGCASCHRRFTSHPSLWFDWLEANHKAEFDKLREIVRVHHSSGLPKIDREAVLDELRQFEESLNEQAH